MIRNKTDVQCEALERATSSPSVINYPAIFEGFMARGLSESDIVPRVNVFTYNAWRAQGRTVRRGEHGVRVTTWVPIAEKLADDGTVERSAGKRCKTAYVFHVSQTDPLPGRRDCTPVAVVTPDVAEAFDASGALRAAGLMVVQS